MYFTPAMKAYRTWYGILVDYGNENELINAIIRLSKDKEFSRQLTENAKLGLSKFSKERMVEETIKIIVD